MKLLILAEKPSAAQKFEKVLGGRVGTINDDSYKIANSFGHLLKLRDPDKQVPPDKQARYADWDSYKGFPWNLEDFGWKKQYKDASCKKQAVKIKQEAAGQDAIVIATDCDPSGEGDLLGWEIINAIGWHKPVYRAYFSSEAEIKKAIINKQLIEQTHNGEYLEALSRERFDFSSMQLSRIATLATREAGFNPIVIKIGRLKSALVQVIYQQWQRINSYVKKPYFEVRYRDGNGNVFKREYSDGATFRFSSKIEAQDDLKNYAPDSIVVDSTVTKKSEPPALINLMDLATILSNQGYSTNSFLKTYQQMYEEDYVSYPRTEDTKVDQQDFEQLIPLTDQIANAVGVDKSLLTHRTARKKYITKKADHGANRPGLKVPKDLDEIKTKYGDLGVAIYQQLAKSWLAALCEDYVYEQQKGHLAHHQEFKATVNIPKQLNYKLVFNEKCLDDEPEKESNEHGFTSIANGYVYEGANPKPANPTLSFLKTFLSKNNIGTGATRVQTITDISSKSPKALLKKKGKNYVLTFNGLASALLTEGCEISSTSITKQLLDYMDQVRTFKLPSKKIPALMTKIVEHDMPIMRNNIAKLKTNIELNKLAKELTPEKARVSGVYVPTGEAISYNGEFSGHTFTDVENKALLSGEKIKINCKSKKGFDLVVPGKLGTREYKGKTCWGFIFDKNEIEIPDDGMHTEGTYIPTGKTIRFKNVWSNHKFTEPEIKNLLSGNEISFENTSKSGTKSLITGKLAHLIYVKGKKEYPYWGFEMDKDKSKALSDSKHYKGIYKPLGKEIRFNNAWAGYKFTETEKVKLLSGEKIKIKLKGKKSAWYATGGLKLQEYNGNKFWGFYAEKKEWA